MGGWVGGWVRRGVGDGLVEELGGDEFLLSKEPPGWVIVGRWVGGWVVIRLEKSALSKWVSGWVGDLGSLLTFWCGQRA